MPLYDDVQQFLVDHPDLKCLCEPEYCATVLDVLERISSGLTSRLEELDEDEEDADQSESPNC